MSVIEYNAKNYTEQGGEVTHIGGKLIFDTGSVVEGLEGKATARVAANQIASVAEDVEGLLADFNALLGKLKASGLMTADSQE